jgi:hypothetical protein
MRALVLPILLTVSAAEAAAGQRETFDLASFTPPSGWERVESSGLLSFRVSRIAGGRSSSGQIFLFPSRPSSASPGANFEAEWVRLITTPLGAVGKPRPQTERTPDGWTAVTGAVNVVRQGAPFTAMLLTATGHGRMMSFVVQLVGQDLVPEVDAFFKELQLGTGLAAAVPVGRGSGPPESRAVAPEPSPAVPAGGEAVGNWVVTVPQGWSHTKLADGGAQYTSPHYGDEWCQLTVFPPRSSSGDLLRDAIGVYQELFKVDPMTGYPYPDPSLVKGTSPYGWEYLVLRKSIGGTVGGNLRGVIVLVAKLGNQLGLVVGTSKPPLTSQCFGELVRDEWPRFFYGLRSRGGSQPVGDQAMASKLVGTWTTATASVSDQYTFATGGRYSSAAGAQYRTRVSSTEVLQTTQAFFGDGTFAIRGNAITFTADKGKGQSSAGFYRLESESKDGRSWNERLCILREGIGDICYRRDR